MHRVVFCFVLFILFSCESPYMIKHPVEKGDRYYLYATFYGEEFNGKEAADGSKFDSSQMTCAARGFPFSTFLEVKSLETGKKVVVKVTDRPGKNVVDLSKAAFLKIDNPDKGKIKVAITVVDGDAPEQVQETQDPDKSGDEAKRTSYTIHLAFFENIEEAKKFAESLSFETYIFVQKDVKEMYAVRTGRFETKEEAQDYKKSKFSDVKAEIVEIAE